MGKELIYKFNCGCELPQRSEVIKEYDGLPPIEIDYYNIRLDCPATWNLISSGRTRGIFQLESNLGRSYSKKLEPDNIEHLAALTALLRPGCLGYIMDGKSMTMHFIDRKQNREPVSYVEDRLEQYLKETFGILVYQEQMIAISKGLAGFTPEQANKLRKSVGKKDMKALMGLKDLFVDGCVSNQVKQEIATQIFENIESSGRYSFNASHSYEYGQISYWTAYIKAHFPLHFFCSSMKYLKDKDELRDLMSEVSLFDIQVKPPSISNLIERFNIKDGYIQFGVKDVKDVGQSSVKLINEIIGVEKILNKEAKEFSWYEFLVLITPKVSTTTVSNLLMCGFLDNVNISRKKQLHEYNTFVNISKGEMAWVQDNWQKFSNLEELLVAVMESKSCRAARKDKVASLISSLRNPGKSVDDDASFVYNNETELLGVALSTNPVSKFAHLANIKCLNFENGKGNKNLIFTVMVVDVDERIIKTGPNAGKKYANIKLADLTGEIETSVFSKEWKEYKSMIVKGTPIMIRGCRNDDGKLRIEQVDLL